MLADTQITEQCCQTVSHQSRTKKKGGNQKPAATTNSAGNKKHNFMMHARSN